MNISTIMLVAILSTASAALVAQDMPLEGTYWRLVELNGEPLAVEAGSRPHIALHDADQRVAGFSGCNRFFARYALEGRQIGFDIVGGGRAVCPELGDLEQRFFAILQQTTALSIAGDRLQLNDGGVPLATFHAVESQ